MMKVKEYLVNRIVDLERDLEALRKQYSLLENELKQTDANCERALDQLDQYEMEREHIKEIITCNLDEDGELYIARYEGDNKTLLAILGIKPEDYKEVTPDAETED